MSRSNIQKFLRVLGYNPFQNSILHVSASFFSRLFAGQIVNNLLGKEQSSSFFPLADENVILPPYTAAADENIIPAVPGGVSTALCSQKEQRSTLLHCVSQSLGPHLQIRQDRGRDDLATGGDMNIA